MLQWIQIPYNHWKWLDNCVWYFQYSLVQILELPHLLYSWMSNKTPSSSFNHVSVTPTREHLWWKSIEPTFFLILLIFKWHILKCCLRYFWVKWSVCEIAAARNILIELTEVRAGWNRFYEKQIHSTNTLFFSGVSNTNTNTNTPAKILSNSNTNTNTALQIQIQIHIETEA